MRGSWPFPATLVLVLAWGGLAFGAEFTWAYGPLLVLAAVAGWLGLLARREAAPRPAHRGLALALGLVMAAAIAQVVPLPARAVAALSPARDAAEYERLFAEAAMRELDEPAAGRSTTGPRPLSIAPARTWLGLAFLAALGLLLLGTAHGLAVTGAVGLARAIVILGAGGAFLQIVQNASASSVVYGIFEPRQFGYTSAPFVNRNHTAGWLVMALSLALGHLGGGVARAMRGVRPTWRDRLVWFSTPDASETVLTAFAIGVIGIAIVSTESRSGVLCLLLAVLLFVWWSVLRQRARSRRAVLATHLGFVLIAAAALGGADAVGRRFAAEGAWESLGGRLHIWQDTLRIVRDFPLTGTGLNTFGIAMLHYQTGDRAQLYIESHNDYLQLAAEGGWLLGVPAAIFLLTLVREIRRRFRAGEDDTRTYWLRAGAVIGLAVMAFQSVWDFTLQMPGAAALFVVLAAIAVHRPAPRVGVSGPAGRPRAGTG